MTRSQIAVGLSGAVVIGAALVWVVHSRENGQILKPSQATLASGKKLYSENCASCHGPNLEGQPDWKSPLPSGRLPAPPHDETGHTWHHTDSVLFQITKHGTAAFVGGGYESDMPAFDGVLTDDEIRAVLAFIKSTWPERERTAQSEMSSKEEERRQ